MPRKGSKAAEQRKAVAARMRAAKEADPGTGGEAANIKRRTLVRDMVGAGRSPSDILAECLRRAEGRVVEGQAIPPDPSYAAHPSTIEEDYAAAVADVERAYNRGLKDQPKRVAMRRARTHYLGQLAEKRGDLRTALRSVELDARMCGDLVDVVEHHGPPADPAAEVVDMVNRIERLAREGRAAGNGKGNGANGHDKEHGGNGAA